MVEVGKIRDKTLVLNGGYISIFRGGKLVWKKKYMAYLLPDGNSYMYRRRVRITELSGKTLTNYQIKIVLGAGDPIFAHARSAGEDIRFCYYPEEEMLSYWIEKYDPVAEEAIIWVKVPEIPANSEIEIYMYYANQEVPSASDGVATFEFFDDFKDASAWVITGTNPDKITINEAEGRIEWSNLTKNETTRAYRQVSGIGSLNRFVIEVDKMKFTSISTYAHSYFATIGNGSDTPDVLDTHIGFSAPYPSDNLNPRVKIAGTSYSPPAIEGVGWSSYRWISIVKNDDTVIYHVYTDAERTSEVADSPKSNADAALSGADFGDYIFAVSAYDVNQSYSHSGHYYRLKIRKYTEPEPSVSVGVEE